MKATKIKLFFVNLFDGLIGKIIEVKISASEKKMRDAMELQVQGYKELIEPLANSVSEIESKLTPEKVQEVSDPSLKVSPDGRFKVRIEKHPNMDVRSFHTSTPLFTEGSSLDLFDFPFVSYKMSEMAEDRKKMVEKLYETNLCVKTSLHPFEIGFSKSPASSWNEITPKIIAIIFDYLNEKYPVPTSEPTKEEPVISQE